MYCVSQFFSGVSKRDRDSKNEVMPTHNYEQKNKCNISILNVTSGKVLKNSYFFLPFCIPSSPPSTSTEPAGHKWRLRPLRALLGNCFFFRKNSIYCQAIIKIISYPVPLFLDIQTPRHLSLKVLQKLLSSATSCISMPFSDLISTNYSNDYHNKF